MLSYIFGSKKINLTKEQQPVIIKKPLCQVYLVIEKNTSNPLGVFDNIADAKKEGQKITYHNCMIIPFILNNSCKYLNDPIFENQ